MSVEESGVPDIGEFHEIESLCLNCHETGHTRLLLDSVPHFQGLYQAFVPTSRFSGLIVSSFQCPHCHYENRSVQPVMPADDRGRCELALEVRSSRDLNRQIVKSQHATFSIIEPELSVAPSHDPNDARLTTLEAILQSIAQNLEAHVASVRADVTPDVLAKYQSILGFLRAPQVRGARVKIQLPSMQMPFKIKLSDPSGLSQIESLATPASSGIRDKQLDVKWFDRTLDEQRLLGLQVNQNHAPPTSGKNLIHVDEKYVPAAISQRADPKQGPKSVDAPEEEELAGKPESHSQEIPPSTGQSSDPEEESKDPDEAVKERLKYKDASGVSFPADCPHCGAAGFHRMCNVDIPAFQECMLMVFQCDKCGYKSNDIKPLRAYGDEGKKWTLRVQEVHDLNRDVLKAETARIEIPEIRFEMETGTFGSVFTTVEGILAKCKESMEASNYFLLGDSSTNPEMFRETLEKLEKLYTDVDSLPFTFILDDPADLSIIGPRYSSHTADQQAAQDEQLTFETYERTAAQNEELGFLDAMDPPQENDLNVDDLAGSNAEPDGAS